MGSGRGQSRRALATTATAEAEFDVDKWTSFVRDQKIGDIKLVDYYEVQFPAGRIRDLLIVAPQMAELATEFFRDLVRLGAITLPSSVDVNDFEFDARIVESDTGYGIYEGDGLMIRNKKTDNEIQCYGMPRRALSPDVNLASHYLQDLVFSMWKSVTSLQHS